MVCEEKNCRKVRKEDAGRRKKFLEITETKGGRDCQALCYPTPSSHEPLPPLR
jgi:hypothetical protein